MTLKNQIIDAVQTAQNAPTQRVELFKADTPSLKKNNFVFFIKPELTLADDAIQFDAILDIIFDRLEAYGVDINQVSLLGANYLDQHNIMGNHYGVINKIAKDAVGAISAEAKATFEEKFGTMEGKTILGGLEFMAQNPDFTAQQLDDLWMTKKSTKLAGGTYCADVEYKGETVYLVNAFHASQLEHFIKQGRSIVVFNASSDRSWDVLRGELIGATNPTSAHTGSLRQIFLAQQDDLGIPVVDQGNNGVHLSAGPVEGLVELIRFFSGSNEATIATMADYPFGQELIDAFGAEKALEIAHNSDITLNGEETNTFDATEEQDSDIAVTTLKAA